MHDVDAAARRRAAEQRRARAFQNFDLLHAVERVGIAVGLVAIGKPVGVDAGIHAAKEIAVEEAVSRGAADIDPADVARDRVGQAQTALLANCGGGHDVDGGGQVFELCPCLAERGRLGERGTLGAIGRATCGVVGRRLRVIRSLRRLG